MWGRWINQDAALGAQMDGVTRQVQGCFSWTSTCLGISTQDIHSIFCYMS
jgi:hypothetical protein